MTFDLRTGRSLPPALVADLAPLIEQARTEDGSAPFSDDLWRQSSSGDTVFAAHIWEAGEVVGVGFVGQQGDRLAGEVLVAIAARGRGIGDGLVRSLLDGVGGEVWLWSHSDHPAARALATRYELERARELLQLRLDVQDALFVDTPEWPDDVIVRPFVVGQDEQAWLDVNNVAFSWHPEQGKQTLDDIRAAEVRPDFDPDGFFLAFRGNQLLGFHWTKVHPEDPSPPPRGGRPQPVGEVYVLCVSPDAQGLGLGKGLTAIGVNYLVERRGVETIMLYVEGDNLHALTVYERAGFRRYLTNVAYRRNPSSRFAITDHARRTGEC